jgi:transcriptional regulator with XRE-family HTH domain
MDLKDKVARLIENKGVTAYEVSLRTKISNSTMSRILSGSTVKLSTKNKELLSKYFQVDESYFNNGINTEIKSDVYSNNTVSNYIVSDASILLLDDEPEIFTNKNNVKFFIFPDDSYKIEVPMMPFNAYASSDIECYYDEDYRNKEFKKTQFSVDKIGKGNYMAFKTKNNSMNGGGINDTPNGAEVLGREIGKHLWKSIHKNDLGFILMCKNSILHKDIINYNSDTGMFTLHSRNPLEEDFDISINDIYRIFNVIKRTF